MDLIQKACDLGFVLKHKEYYLYEIQKWLREKHNLHIVIQTGLGEEPWWSGQVIEISTNEIVNDISNSWKSYEAALEYILWLTLKENI